MLVMTPGFLFLQRYINILIVTTKKPFFFAFFCYFLHPQTFFNNLLHLSEEKRIFAEAKLHSAICKQAFIALVCIIFAARKLNHLNKEVDMDLFDRKRQERLEAARKASTASKEAARAFLIRAGILLPNGEVAPHLR